MGVGFGFGGGGVSFNLGEIGFCLILFLLQQEKKNAKQWLL